ncbi:MAG: NAD(P)-binding domain-containing protein, partial [Betaproteobacteria bacterium]|nr:NAD(P)-binding domain-containing protein [Betaproteobacteria bacterium]
MKILVLGAGGTGGYFGGRLAQAGNDVTFLVREKRAAQLAREGLVIESPRDTVTLRVATVLAADVRPEYDLVILSCKAYDLQSAIAAIVPAMGSHTCVVPLLNGMTHMAALEQAFGPRRVMGGVAQIAATLTPAG